MITAVSIEILRKVKQALDIFQTDITGTMKRANLRMADTLAHGRAVLQEAESKVAETQQKVRALQDREIQIEYQIKDYKGKEMQWQGRVDWLTSQIMQLESQIALEQNRLSGLLAAQAKINNGDQNEAAAQIASQIAAQEALIGTLQTKCTNYTVERSGLYNKLAGIRGEIDKAQKELSNIQWELDEQKGILQRRIDRRDRLNNAFREMEQDLINYQETLRSFETESQSMAGRNRNAVAQCIVSIEEYINTML